MKKLFASTFVLLLLTSFGVGILPTQTKAASLCTQFTDPADQQRCAEINATLCGKTVCSADYDKAAAQNLISIKTREACVSRGVPATECDIQFNAAQSLTTCFATAADTVASCQTKAAAAALQATIAAADKIEAAQQAADKAAAADAAARRATLTGCVSSDGNTLLGQPYVGACPSGGHYVEKGVPTTPVNCYLWWSSAGSYPDVTGQCGYWYRQQSLPQNPTAAPAATSPTAAPTAPGSGNLGYTPLEPLPGLGNIQAGQTVQFGALLNSFFKILISLGGLVAVAALIFSGIVYMVSDVVHKKSEALHRIQSALWGLLLLIASYLILYTINPQLLVFSLFVDPTAGLTTMVGSNGNSVDASTQPAYLQTATNACTQSGKVMVQMGAGGGWVCE